MNIEGASGELSAENGIVLSSRDHTVLIRT